jgi:hypothetical protein
MNIKFKWFYPKCKLFNPFYIGWHRKFKPRFKIRRIQLISTYIQIIIFGFHYGEQIEKFKLRSPNERV